MTGYLTSAEDPATIWDMAWHSGAGTMYVVGNFDRVSSFPYSTYGVAAWNGMFFLFRQLDV